MKTRYRHTQNGMLLMSILLLSMVFLSYKFIYQIGTKPMPLIPYIVIMLIISIAILLFYKLTISVDNEKIEAVFGIGLFKKVIQLDTIQSVEKYKTPWYVGVGIRLTEKGWLWNVSTGDAILIKTTKGTFLLGSNDVDTIIKIINTKIKH